mmetsp:Transcript_16605/g.2307  ORF Transcript_16605/g.2307 Transcript_16605/m.2307 type:complete len:151 (+) Transcript_16605:131-583(+)
MPMVMKNLDLFPTTNINLKEVKHNPSNKITTIVKLLIIITITPSLEDKTSLKLNLNYVIILWQLENVKMEIIAIMHTETKNSDNLLLDYLTRIKDINNNKEVFNNLRDLTNNLMKINNYNNNLLKTNNSPLAFKTHMPPLPITNLKDINL